tara:strand:- start:265 stop:744 length:480 start_codon:yes stop_codon:yes gene_type:complete
MSPDTKMMSDMNPMADRTQKQTVIKQTMPKPMGMPKPQERKSKNVEVAAGMPKMAGGGELKEPNNPGLKKLPEKVRNRMGYKAYGGKMKKMAEGGKLMETRQEIIDRISKKDTSLSKSQLSRAFNMARGMDPVGRLSNQDIERVIKALKDPSNRRSSRD